MVSPIIGRSPVRSLLVLCRGIEPRDVKTEAPVLGLVRDSHPTAAELRGGAVVGHGATDHFVWLSPEGVRTESYGARGGASTNGGLTNGGLKPARPPASSRRAGARRPAGATSRSRGPCAARSSSWRPSSTMRPRSSTWMRSACITVDRRWAISTVITAVVAGRRRGWCGVISSSVSESSDEVASSKTSRCGRRRSARAIDRRCFSPPGDLHAALADDGVEALVGAGQQAVAGRALAAPRGTRRRSRPGRTNSRFSRIEPENSCVSWVTKPICSRSGSRSTRSWGWPL